MLEYTEPDSFAYSECTARITLFHAVVMSVIAGQSRSRRTHYCLNFNRALRRYRYGGARPMKGAMEGKRGSEPGLGTIRQSIALGDKDPHSARQSPGS